MSVLALTFAAPFLLLGLLAVAIPVLLHLLARSRAQEVLFPTLRFLRISMEKTARRRRIQHVLLMFVRMALLALLALAVAEPISQALGGWMSGKSYACVLIVDSSMSMSASTGDPARGFATRLDKARSEARSLLSGPEAERPTLAALWTTNGPAPKSELTARLDALRLQADAAAPSFGKAPIAQRLAAALDALGKVSVPQKAVALFSDLQKVSFDDLLAAEGLAKAGDVHLLIVNTAARPASNVAVTEVKVEGRPVVGQLQTVTAAVTNYSATEKVVHVGLRVRGQDVGAKAPLTLAPAGEAGSTAAAKLNWWPRETGDVTGEVVLDEADDLPQDNHRWFCRHIGARIKALIVRGPVGDPRQAVTDPAWALNLALNPFTDPTANWLIETQTVDAEAFTPESLAGAEIVFLCDVPKFTPDQVYALEALAARGATVAFFLGPSVDVANYNDVLRRSAGSEGPLLPAAIQPAVGEVGPLAGALFLKWVDLTHPYFHGLYKDLADVKEDIRGFVQRRYRLGEANRPLDQGPRPPAVLVRLENDEPLIVTWPYGQGRVVLCATGAAPGWSNLPATSLFPPMLIRMSMQARRGAAAEESHSSGSAVTIRPREMGEANQIAITVTLPGAVGAERQGNSERPAGARAESAPSTGEKVNTVTVQAVRTGEGLAARFAQTEAAGVYTWKAASPEGPDHDEYGAFVVNPPADEGDLRAMTPEALRAALVAKGFPHVYVGGSLAEASSAALAAAQKRNWWDVLAAAAILALVVEALVANRAKTQRESAVPAHLNPKIAA